MNDIYHVLVTKEYQFPKSVLNPRNIISDLKALTSNLLAEDLRQHVIDDFKPIGGDFFNYNIYKTNNIKFYKKKNKEQRNTEDKYPYLYSIVEMLTVRQFESEFGSISVEDNSKLFTEIRADHPYRKDKTKYRYIMNPPYQKRYDIIFDQWFSLIITTLEIEEKNKESKRALKIEGKPYLLEAIPHFDEDEPNDEHNEDEFNEDED